jgi:hypothetical protein
MIYYNRINKDEGQGKNEKCHTKTMIHSEAGEAEQ